MSSTQDYVNKLWYNPTRAQKVLSLLLLPLAALLQLIARRRRSDLSRTARPVAAPVIVIGNIAIGGTGKTPIIIALARELSKKGYKPGVISRGYGGCAEHYPLLLDANTPISQSGDEPALIRQSLNMPVCVAPNRPSAAERLIDEGCDIILSDDGLQHYKLARDIEIVVVDATRLFGNQRTLPAGPLREGKTRISEVDCVITNGGCAEALHEQQFEMALKPLYWQKVCQKNSDTTHHILLEDFNVGDATHAISGIGNPQRFFNTLLELNVDVSVKAFSDHHDYSIKDLQQYSGKMLLMTAKDAVKCRQFHSLLDTDQWFFLDVEASLDPEFYPFIKRQIDRAEHRCQIERTHS